MEQDFFMKDVKSLDLDGLEIMEGEIMFVTGGFSFYTISGAGCGCGCGCGCSSGVGCSCSN